MVLLHCVNAAIPFNPLYRTAAQRIEPFVPWPAKEIPVSLYGVATLGQLSLEGASRRFVPDSGSSPREVGGFSNGRGCELNGSS